MTSRVVCKSALALAIFALLLAGCGGGSSSPSAEATSTGSAPPNNVQAIAVNSGPAGQYANGAFTSVTVCVPGTNTCQTIDGVLVDTGSSGLRLLSSSVNIALPRSSTAGANLTECTQFQDGYTWGPVATADVAMAGEKASAVPIQLVGAAGTPTEPSSCSSTGTAENDLSSLGANGILGVGNWRQDCGGACTVTGSQNPGLYYSCTSSSCQITTASLVAQVQNPIWMFSADNNGVLIDLPAVPNSSGALTLAGSMIFGIGTQSNNSLGGATVLTLDDFGNFTTTYNGKPYSSSFLDTGSNGYFFLDSASTGLPECTGQEAGWYCPASTTSFTATNQGSNGASTTITFSVDNADTLFQSANTVFPTLAGDNAGSFDWGLPFFYGRKVFTAIESQTTPAGAGPWVAY